MSKSSFTFKSFRNLIHSIELNGVVFTILPNPCLQFNMPPTFNHIHRIWIHSLWHWNGYSYFLLVSWRAVGIEMYIYCIKFQYENRNRLPNFHCRAVFFFFLSRFVSLLLSLSSYWARFRAYNEPETENVPFMLKYCGIVRTKIVHTMTVIVEMKKTKTKNNTNTKMMGK